MGSLSVSANSSMAAERVVVISGKEVQRPVEILSATNDEFDFVTVEMKEKMDPKIFASSLRDSVSHWRQQVSVCSDQLLLIHYFSLRFTYRDLL